MILFGTSFSPFARKVLVFAREKRLELELTSPADDPQKFRIASPFGKIPAIMDGDFSVSDSSVIVAYLEQLQPEPNLIPDAPSARARTLWFEEFADAIVQVCVREIFGQRVAASMFYGREGNLEAAKKVEDKHFPPVAQYLESQIPASGYLVEDRLTLADIAVGSAFANLDHAACRPDPQLYPKSVAYLNRIWSMPSFADYLTVERAAIAASRSAQ